MRWMYNLEHIIRFFQRQAKDKYAVIEALVHLREFPWIADEEKLKIYVETLRKYGLYDQDYDGPKDNFLESHRAIPIPEDPRPKPEDDIVWEDVIGDFQQEFYNVRLLSGVKMFSSIMN